MHRCVSGLYIPTIKILNDVCMSQILMGYHIKAAMCNKIGLKHHRACVCVCVAERIKW